MTVSIASPEPSLRQDMADVVRLFFGYAAILSDGAGDVAIRHLTDGGREVFSAGDLSAEVPSLGAGRDALEKKRLRKRAVKLGLYALLKRMTGVHPPWGSLTGIRPSRLYHEALAEGLDPVRALIDVFDVTEERAALLREIADMQRGLRSMPRGQFDLYIGIPFCRTRCAYCSFFSADLRDETRVRAYLAALEQEIDALGTCMAAQGLACRSIYFGGGTPTSIGDEALHALLMRVRAAFGTPGELTVEAGRPDCTGPDTFAMLRDASVTRVSINPQSMNDQTLRAIGRQHSAQDVLDAFARARAAGGLLINMDLIVGLPGEDEAAMARTLAALAPLGMDNLTVHTLAIKHASTLHEHPGRYPLPRSEQSAAMLALAHTFARGRGMQPYYLYRQKYMAANLENIGYALPGTQCLYNIDMMEETHTVVALGAGAISKRMLGGGLRHDRLPNPKSIERYCDTITEGIRRKIGFFTQAQACAPPVGHDKIITV